MRRLIFIAAFGCAFLPARAHEPLVPVTLDSATGYVVPEGYAAEHKAELAASMPGITKIEGFWTPSEQDIAVADRTFWDLIHDATKDPALLFPDLAKNSNPDAPDSLEHERRELVLVAGRYDRYLRQYVGVVIDGKKLVFCNYSDGPKLDASTDYIFIQKVFVPDGTVHFLQGRFDPEAKTCSNVSMIGSWQPATK